LGRAVSPVTNRTEAELEKPKSLEPEENGLMRSNRPSMGIRSKENKRDSTITTQTS
tara:strand:+ start:930 stop:1097 length:168 start_codon:yes stop_codon:yes gene_type:complete